MVSETPVQGGGTNRRVSIRRLQPLWSLAIAVLVVVFAWRQRDELSEAMRELRLADWRWLALVVLGGVLMHACMTQALSLVFWRIGRRIPFIPALMTHTEREMIATVVPGGGAASFVTLVSRFGEYRVTRNDAALATMLYSVVGHLSFIAVAIPAIILLIERHQVSDPILIGAVVVLIVAIALGLLVVGLLKGKRFPESIEQRAPGFVQEFRESARATNVPATSLLAPFFISLAGDLFGVFSMWAALRAVGVHAGFEIALAAYAVGTMLQLAAPVFQGLGIVEVSLILLLERLGVPVAQAAGATILYRLVDVWLPVIFGVGVHARYQRTLRGLPANLPAIWTALSGFLALASVMPVRIHLHFLEFRRADGIGMLHPYHADRTVTLVAGFLLLLLSLRLARRQHAAWLVSLALSCLLTVLFLTRDADQVGAIISGANVVILLIYRSKFRVRSDVPTLRRGIYLILVSFSVTYLFGVASLWLADKRHFGRGLSIRTSLRTATDIYLGFSDGGLDARTARGEWIIDSMHLLAVLSILVAAFAILHPFVWRHRVQRAETERARLLIEHYGDSSLDRFKYWPDKFQFFATDDVGVVSFGLSGRIALVLGDPSAKDEQAFEQTLDEFLELCSLNGWDPAFHQVSAQHLDDYRARGFTAMMVGQDAIVSLPDFTLSGKSMGSFRSARNRAQREGRFVEHVEPPLSQELIDELRSVSDEWLMLEGRRERTFTLGQFDEGYLRESPVLILRSAEGRADAFINLIPDGAPGEITFDLMRHRVDAPNGSMDLLMLALIDLGKAEGSTTLDLGMVPFVQPESDESTATADRAIAQLAGPMSRFFASESLFAYKNKFHPSWEPRYLVVTSVAQLPRVALAITRLAEIDNQHPFWRLLPRRRGEAPDPPPASSASTPPEDNAYAQ